MNSNIKSCPLCGNPHTTKVFSNDIYTYFQIYCSRCNLVLTDTIDSNIKTLTFNDAVNQIEKTIQKWNTRKLNE